MKQAILWTIGIASACAYIALIAIDWWQVRQEYKREMKKMKERQK